MSDQPTSDLTLWYRQPAEQWVEALPIGNGRVGAMIFGGVASERLQLNHDTLWSGVPSDWLDRELGLLSGAGAGGEEEGRGDDGGEQDGLSALVHLERDVG